MKKKGSSSCVVICAMMNEIICQPGLKYGTCPSSLHLFLISTENIVNVTERKNQRYATNNLRSFEIVDPPKYPTNFQLRALQYLE
jgi:hypothetical protein